MSLTLGELADRLPYRILRKIEVRDDGCWNWIGSINRDGYGRVQGLSGRLDSPHRLTKLASDGIPQGAFLDHLCRNRRCCNPAHLEPVTNAENAQRGVRARLNWNAVQYIDEHPEIGGAELGRKFGVTGRAVRHVRAGLTWRRSLAASQANDAHPQPTEAAHGDR